MISTIDSIINRRSIRKYKPYEISEDIIRNIIKAGTLAPSAKNRQPWFFVVLTKHNKDLVADLMQEKYEICKTKEQNIQGYSSSVLNTSKIIKKSPVLILIFKDNDKAWEIGDTLSIGACIQNMLLYATSIGIGSLWIRDTYCVEDEMNKMYGNGKVLISSVSFGLPDEYPSARPRNKSENITSWF